MRRIRFPEWALFRGGGFSSIALSWVMTTLTVFVGSLIPYLFRTHSPSWVIAGLIVNIALLFRIDQPFVSGCEADRNRRPDFFLVV